jgi:hypothetical protein
LSLTFRLHIAWAGFELTTLVVIGTYLIGSCKSNYHANTTTTAPDGYKFLTALITLNPSVKEYSLQGWTYFCAENIWEKTFKTKQPRLERRKQKNRLIIYLSSRQFGMTGCTSRDNKLYKHHLLYVVNIYVLVLVLHSVKDMISFTTRKNPLFSIWTLISTYYMYSTSVQQSSSSSTYSNY